MIFAQIVFHIEKILYEICLWFLLGPKTLVKIFIRPKWIQLYVTREANKSIESRYNTHLSPIIFYILFSVVPLLLVLDINSEDIVKECSKLGENSEFLGGACKTIIGSTETRFLVIALFLLISPTVFSIVVHKAAGKTITRSSFEKIFHMQCLIFTPVYLTIALSILFLVDIHKDNLLYFYSVDLFVVYGLVGWFFYVQTSVMRTQTRRTKPSITKYAFLGMFVLLNLMTLIIFLPAMLLVLWAGTVSLIELFDL